MPFAPDTLHRAHELDAMSNEDFIALWEEYKHCTPNELNTLEPFYIVVAMKKLCKLVKG